MTGRIAHIWRHPIKGHGREELKQTALAPGRTLPWDRTWAVAHDASQADERAWAPCHNFSRGSKTPEIMAISTVADEASGRLTLSHPDRPDLEFDPATEAAEFLAWVNPLMDPARAMPARLVRVPDRGMTDTDYPSISIGNLSSLRALSDKAGIPVDQRRFRINFWLDGLGPWEEFEWIGRDLRIGPTLLRVTERIERCLATHADPDRGKRNLDVLGTLEAGWGHRDFGIYATVIEGGEIRTGDVIEVVR